MRTRRGAQSRTVSFTWAAYDIQHPDSTISINIDALHDFGGYGGLLVDVLDHELAEAMGLGSGCENDGSGCDYFPWVQDMFRYKSNHEHPTTERTYSVSEKYWVYFSTDNGHSPLLGTGHGPYSHESRYSRTLCLSRRLLPQLQYKPCCQRALRDLHRVQLPELC